MYVCVYIHAHKQTHNLCIHVYMHTYTLAYHVYIHTYIHTYYTGTTIVNYAKAIVKTSDKDASMKNYQDFVVDIPPLVNASNFRKGSCNCLSFAQPIEHCVCVSVHDLTGQSAFYEYIEDTLTKVLSTALVLAGWPSHPWSQMGRGPVPGSLEALKVHICAACCVVFLCV
jgi:hypothetical protein